MTKRLFGSIQIRESESLALDVPSWIKVILSAFLVFPMHYWIVFPIKEVDVTTKSPKSTTKSNNKHKSDKNKSKRNDENVNKTPKSKATTTTLDQQQQHSAESDGVGDDDEHDELLIGSAGAATTVVVVDDADEKDEEELEAEDTKAELNKKLIEIKNNRKVSQFLNMAATTTSHCRNLLLSPYTTQPPQQQKTPSQAKESEADDGEASRRSRRWRLAASGGNNNNVRSKKYVTPPFYEKIYMVWNSPYTKFWVYFWTYMCYLLLFAVVTLWPCCGHLLLDTTLWLWTAAIAIEDTRIAYQNFLAGSQLPMTGPLIEIALMISFLVAFFMVRIVGSWDDVELMSADTGYDRIFVSKAVLCFYLLYFFYRTLFIFLPISHQLGPMLVRMKLMVKHDFMTYMRLFIIFMTAGGVALNAILYPFHPMNLELLKRVLLMRGFLQLFAADKHDLERTNDECKRANMSHMITRPYSCVQLTDGAAFGYSEQTLGSYGVSYACNYQSLMAWIILIQYFILIKLFLPSLLTAMFSATGTRVSAISEQLWMSQRYEIVLEYEKRLIFPGLFVCLFVCLKIVEKETLFFILLCFVVCSAIYVHIVLLHAAALAVSQASQHVRALLDVFARLVSHTTRVFCSRQRLGRQGRSRQPEWRRRRRWQQPDGDQVRSGDAQREAHEHVQLLEEHGRALHTRGREGGQREGQTEAGRDQPEHGARGARRAEEVAAAPQRSRHRPREGAHSEPVLSGADQEHRGAASLDQVGLQRTQEEQLHSHIGTRVALREHQRAALLCLREARAVGVRARVVRRK